MLTELARITLHSWFNGAPYIGRRRIEIMHSLSSPASPSQALFASSTRLSLVVCVRSRNYG
jgi:hypothetical protein